jgi:general stress protein 26
MVMEQIPGLDDAFQKAKVVFMTTYDGDTENTRQMTNYNDNPYRTIWFPTERDTQKVKDLEKNNKVLLTFPGPKRGEFYEITGEASFASDDEVRQKWEWWWLYWHPSQKNRFWFPATKDDRRVIINIKPSSAIQVQK